MRKSTFIKKWVASIHFRKWFATATEPSGTALSDLYSLDHLRIVLPGERADLPAWDIEDRYGSILAARYDGVQMHAEVASFTLAGVGPKRLRIRLYDIFRLDPDGMAYSRESLGEPVELTFDFERRDFTTEMQPGTEAASLTPDEIKLLWSLLGRSHHDMAYAA